MRLSVTSVATKPPAMAARAAGEGPSSRRVANTQAEDIEKIWCDVKVSIAVNSAITTSPRKSSMPVADVLR